VEQTVAIPEPPLVSEYRRQPGVYDEMVDAAGEVRPHWRYLANALGTLGLPTLHDRWREARRLLRESGATYNVYGDPQGLERPWVLDPIPVLISSDEWRDIEWGLMQRAELLDLILRDLYGPQELVRRGLLPPELVFSHAGFLRPCHPMEGSSAHKLILYAADIVRGTDGRVQVLSDRTQAPSGAGYALENRVVLSRVLPSLYRDSHVHRPRAESSRTAAATGCDTNRYRAPGPRARRRARSASRISPGNREGRISHQPWGSELDGGALEPRALSADGVPRARQVSALPPVDAQSAGASFEGDPRPVDPRGHRAVV